jgi:uncharacterized membrane protein YeaQ/YmgE (transglycosylase-associated protein family)
MDSVIVFLLVGLVAGWLASRVVGSAGGGLIADLVVGVIGAVIGGFLFSRLGISAAGIPPLLFQLIAAVAGSIVLLLLLRLVRR